MHVLLFIFYGFVLSYALIKIPFFQNSGIRLPILLLYFGLRVATGCLHNWIAYRYYPNHGDVWTFFTNSFNTRRELFTDLRLFWADNSTLAYLPHNLIEWMHVLFNFLSFDNLYINTLFFSFLTLGGIIALFRVFNSRFRMDPISSLTILLLPSTLFWTSCIHTEGLVYPLLGFFFYYLDRLLTGSVPSGNGPFHGPPSHTREKATDRLPPPNNRASAGPIFRCLFFFLLVVFFRPAILIGLLPAVVFWILAEKGILSGKYSLARKGVPANQNALAEKGILTGKGIPAEEHAANKKRPLYWLTITAAAAIIVLSFRPLLHTLSARQNEFQQLTGNSRIDLPTLEPTAASFLHVLPRAILNGFFQPLPGSGGQRIYQLFSIELIGIWLVVAYALISRLIRRAHTRPDPVFPPPAGPFPSPPEGPFLPPFAIACILFALCGMLLVGYIIPFAGSIIRYRSLYLPFLLAPFLYTLRNQPIVRIINNWLRKYIVELPDFK